MIDDHLWLPQAQSFIGKEEEGPVLPYGPPEYAAKIVLALLRTRLALLIGEPVVGVQLVIAEILEGCAVKLVRAGPGND